MSKTVFHKKRGNQLAIEVNGVFVDAFVDWTDNCVMVPIVKGVDRELIASAIYTYWPTVEMILWPEDLDVATI